MTPSDLRAALAELGLSQIEFAQRVPVAYVTVYRWTSERDPRPVPDWIATILRLMRENAELRDDLARLRSAALATAVPASGVVATSAEHGNS